MNDPRNDPRAGRLSAGALLLLGLVACGRGPPLERYRLLPVPADSGASRVPADQTIAVEPYVTQGIYAEPQIVYRVGEASYGAYPNREWAIPLSSMLADATVRRLRAAPGGAERVTDDAAGGAHELVWRGRVREFEEVDRGDSVLAAVHLDGAVVRVADDSVLWQGSARAERRVPEAKSMPAVVDALSALTAAAVDQLVREAEPTLGER